MWENNFTAPSPSSSTGGSGGGQCPAIPITLQQVQALRTLVYVFSALGIGLTGPVIFVKLLTRDDRRFPSHVSTLFMVMAFGYHSIILSGRSIDWDAEWVRVHIDKMEPSKFCQIQGILFQFCAAAMVWLWVEVALSLWLVVVQQMSFAELRGLQLRFHLWWIILAVVQTWVPFALHPAVPQTGAPYCWLTNDSDYLIQFLSLHLQMGSCMVVGICLVFSVLRRLLGVANGSRQDVYAGVVHSYVIRHTFFTLLFACVFLLVVAFLLNQVLDKQGLWCVKFPMAVAHACAAAGPGIFAFSVLGPTSRNLTVIRRACQHCCNRNNLSEAEAWDSLPGSQSSLEQLENPLTESVFD